VVRQVEAAWWAPQVHRTSNPLPASIDFARRLLQTLDIHLMPGPSVLRRLAGDFSVFPSILNRFFCSQQDDNAIIQSWLWGEVQIGPEVRPSVRWTKMTIWIMLFATAIGGRTDGKEQDKT